MPKLLLLVFLAMIIAVPAFASPASIESMSLDELVALHHSVEAELTSRINFSDSLIGRGEYLVGVDIKAGAYEIVCTQSDAYGSDDNMGRFGVAVYNTKDAYDSDKSADWQKTYLAVGMVVFLRIEDGMVLSVFGGNGLLRPFEHSWAP